MSATSVESRERIDVDRASRDALLALPGIGPTLADRIVADRVLHGPFGCLNALQSVKGVGTALLHRLDTLVTFSGQPRPDC